VDIYVQMDRWIDTYNKFGSPLPAAIPRAALVVPLAGERVSRAEAASFPQPQPWLKIEVDTWGVITISRGSFERCGSNKETPP